jgi:hypothetical protein
MDWIVAAVFLAITMVGGVLCYLGFSDPAMRVKEDPTKRRHKGLLHWPSVLG